jgi:hypothetical protein
MPQLERELVLVPNSKARLISQASFGRTLVGALLTEAFLRFSEKIEMRLLSGLS